MGFASRHSAAVLPGYTHLQRAQPVLFAHHLLAYVEMLDRDAGRLADAAARMDACPLGSGAGTVSSTSKRWPAGSAGVTS